MRGTTDPPDWSEVGFAAGDVLACGLWHDRPAARLYSFCCGNVFFHRLLERDEGATRRASHRVTAKAGLGNVWH